MLMPVRMVTLLTGSGRYRPCTAACKREYSLKICEICEKVEACVEVKHYENGVLRELALCEDCAQAHGLNLPFNLADLLLETTLQEVVAGPGDVAAAGSDAARCCAKCRMRLVDFRKTGRLGCPACYHAWPDVLEPMLMGMHRSLAYKGVLAPSAAGDVEVLERALQDAVRREDYEEAARLRDRVRSAADVISGKQREFLFDEDQ